MKKLISIILMIVLLLSCVCFVSAEQEDTEVVAIIKDGNPEYTIVYPEAWLQGHEDYRETILDGISSYIQKQTGADIPVVGAISSIQDKEIYIGITDRLIGSNQKQREAEGADFSFDTELYGDEGYLIRTCGTRFIIIGASVEATKKAIGVFASEFRRNSGNDTGTLLMPASFNRVSCGVCETDLDVVMSVGDIDISEYAVIISADAPEETVGTANALRRAILDLTANELPLYRDDQEYDGKKILIGPTAFTDASELADGEYMIKSEGGELVLAGANGYLTKYAVDRFIEQNMLISNGVYKGNSALKIPADLSVISEPAFAYQCEECPGYPHYLRDTARNLLGEKGPVCYSDPAVADRLYDALIAEEPQTGDEVFLISNTADYCECEKCGGKADAFLATVNAVAKRFRSSGVIVSTLAQNETRNPADMRMEENVRVYFAAPEMCCAHALVDDSCEINRAVKNDLLAWSKASSDVYVLDFSQNYYHFSATFPDFGILQPNIAYYKEIGARGVVMAWDSDVALLEFGELRTALIHALLNDPTMSPDDYQVLYDGVMTELYKSYAPKMKEYIEKFTDAAADHFTIFSKPSEILPIAKIDGKSGAEAYDLSLAKELGQIWEDVYDRHDPPEEALIGPEMQMFNDAYIHSEYYKPLHARVQYSAWIDANIPVEYRTEVYRAIIESFR